MCTSIVEITEAEGMAKRGDEWFPLTQAVVAYDHAHHAPLGDVITLDFFNKDLDVGARAGVEITLESAKALRAALDRAGLAGGSLHRDRAALPGEDGVPVPAAVRVRADDVHRDALRHLRRGAVVLVPEP